MQWNSIVSSIFPVDFEEYKVMNTADDKKDKEGKPRLLEEQQAEELPVHEEPEQIEGKEQKMLSGDDKKLLELEDKLLGSRQTLRTSEKELQKSMKC